MDFVIVFFRDILDGPVYYIVASICAILICSCIGYLGERYLEDKKRAEEHSHTHANVSGRAAFDAEHQNNTSQNAEQEIQSAVAPTSEQSQGNEAAPAEVLSSEEENVEDEDPNANVNYNVTTISSDELLEDD